MNKVSHIITTIERGGAENQLLILVREQVKLGIDVTVIPLKGQPDLVQDFLQCGAKVEFAAYNQGIIRQILKLRKFISDDCVTHAHLPRAEILAALSKPRYFVFSRHNTEPFFPKAPGGVSKLLSRFVAVRATCGIAISNAVKDYLFLSKEIRTGYPIHTVLYGIDSRIKIDDARMLEIKNKHRIQEANFVVGTIARLTPQKDLETLLRCFSEVRNTKKNAKLLLIGSGPEFNKLQSLAISLGIQDDLVWVGKTPYIYEYLSIMDVFVLTSLYEGFGLVLIEAMVSQKPIVASNNSAIPEVLGKVHFGLARTSDPHDFAEKVLSFVDFGRRSQILALQKNRLAEFNPNEMARKIQDIYSIVTQHH